MQIKYSSYLRHGNDAHDPKTGRFTFKIASKVTQGGKNAADTAYQYVDRFSKAQKGPRADLSNMSDEELRKILTREEMERRYDTYFNTPTERKGVEYVKTALTITAGVLGVVTTGLGVAAGIQTVVSNANKNKGGDK